MKRKLVRKIIGGLSFTSALFIFQACYGTPRDFGLDLLIEGQVKSESSGMPIQGIKVTVANLGQYDITNEIGAFSFYTEKYDQVLLQFQDIDADQNGLFFDKDTMISPSSESIHLDIVMKEK